MNMKLKLVALAVASMMTTSVAVAQEIKPMHIDDGAYSTPEMDAYIAEMQGRQNSLLKRAAELANATGEPAIVDVSVLMHSTWIESLKEPITKDANGKFYENGAQFAIARIKAQFDYFNETLEMQNVNARLRPAYFATVSPNIIVSNAGTPDTDFVKIIVCTLYNDGSSDYQKYKSACEAENLMPVRQKVQGKVDIVYYIRNKLPEETRVGVGPMTIGAMVYDTYVRDMKSAVAGGNPSEDFLSDRRFGYTNADVFSHEMGHVFSAMHEVYSSEPATEEDNRAYACGKRLDDIPRVEGDLSTMRKTIMWHFTGKHHRFFSDSEIIVDGDRCGVVGVANNITTVRKNAPLVALNYNMPALSSAVSFVDTAVVVGRELGKATLVLRRTGDLTQPAYLSLTAKDGSAWESRDFTFGLQEISFAAGESEKSVDVTLLPRARGHLDTKFNVVIQAAIGASYATSELEVTIVSDKAIQPGEVGFANAQADVFEGSTAQVTINRAKGVDGDITFKVTPVNGTAVKGTDFNAEAVVKTLKDGESSVIVDVPTTKRTGAQGTRALTLNISEISGGAVAGSVSQATVNIKDVAENGSLEFATANVSVNENASATLTINRTNGTDGEVTVRVQTLNGSAVSGTDFTAVDQVVTIPAGQASASVVVNVVNRSGNQGSRYFDVQLSNVSGGAVLGGAVTSRVTIADVVAPPAPETGGSSGGSFGMYSLAGLLLLALRRRKLVK
jgi:hypothetical protein